MALSLITPSKITAGDTAGWLIYLTDYPSPAWVLSYTLVNATSKKTFSGTQYLTSSNHHILIPKATTAAWGAGVYGYQASVTDGTSRYVVETGTIEIIPDFAQVSTGLDNRTFAKKSLDAIEAVIYNRASQAQLEYTIAGRQLKFISPKDLMDLRDRFAAEYRSEEKRKSGKNIFGSVQVAFTGNMVDRFRRVTRE